MINLLPKSILAILATLVSLSLMAPGASASQRYTTPPPLVLSPDLTQPMVLQLRGTGIARTSYSKRQKHPRASRLKSKQKVRRVAARRTGFFFGRKQRPAHKKPQSRNQFDPSLLPTLVNYSGREKPGTIVVNTAERRLYLVLADGKARRYGVGVGRVGFQWNGTNKISRKAEWPSWRPPAAMIAREKAKGKFIPSYMPGGLDNPLGARALYLGSTLYRIHGTTQEWSIGKAVSSGCIRMRNQDVIDLYQRVGAGTKVVVL